MYFICIIYLWFLVDEMLIVMVIFFKKWDYVKVYYNLNGFVFLYCIVYICICKDENNYLYFYDMYLIFL